MEKILSDKIRVLEENEILKEENKKVRTIADSDSNGSDETWSIASSDGLGVNSPWYTAPAQIVSAVPDPRPSFMVTKRFKAFGLGLNRLERNIEARVSHGSVFQVQHEKK